MTDKDKLRNVSAISSMIGYVSSLEPGTKVTAAYVKRLHDHYIPKLEEIIQEPKV